MCIYQIGKRIKCGHYAATCQLVDSQQNIALFLLDTYLDKRYQMNKTDSNKGGYLHSDLRRKLNRDFDKDPEFDCIREQLVPFHNGDQVRIPVVEELFRINNWFEPFSVNQWPLQRERDPTELTTVKSNGMFTEGWLQNKCIGDKTSFACTEWNNADCGLGMIASFYYGVRPVFQLRMK